MRLGGRHTPPESPWEGLHVTNFDQCLHVVMAIGKCTDVFRGIFWLEGGGGVEKSWLFGENCSRSNLSGGKNISVKRAQDFQVLFLKTMKK